MTEPNAKSFLDLHDAPTGAKAAEYNQLLALFDEMGERLEEGLVSKEYVREWERLVCAHLRDAELDRFMRPSDDPETPPANQRHSNLRAILLARKGIKPQYS